MSTIEVLVVVTAAAVVCALVLAVVGIVVSYIADRFK